MTRMMAAELPPIWKTESKFAISVWPDSSTTLHDAKLQTGQVSKTWEKYFALRQVKSFLVQSLLDILRSRRKCVLNGLLLFLPLDALAIAFLLVRSLELQLLQRAANTRRGSAFSLRVSFGFANGNKRVRSRTFLRNSLLLERGFFQVLVVRGTHLRVRSLHSCLTGEHRLSSGRKNYLAFVLEHNLPLFAHEGHGFTSLFSR